MELLLRLFGSPGFTPHGYSYLWNARLVWLHVITDALIGLAYFAISAILLWFARKRRDVPFSWLFVPFGAFLIACGLSHAMEIWNVWLATVYGIVRQHGGFLNVYSEIGKGTTFRCYFPASTEVAAHREKVEDTGPVRGGSETILIAEDHEGLSQLALETLTRLGYQVMLATDGEQAVADFCANPDRVSLAVLDVVLPKLGGPEIYARIR